MQKNLLHEITNYFNARSAYVSDPVYSVKLMFVAKSNFIIGLIERNFINPQM